MTTDFDFAKALQERIAWLAIGRSTLRKQGAPGMVAVARRFLARLPLCDFTPGKRTDFDETLNRHTARLMRKFPEPANKNWGAARKSLNIFLRDVFYSQLLRARYGLSRIEPWLELPLDSYAYAGLCNDGDLCTDWPGVKHLTCDINAHLQNIAAQVASRFDTFRVHLDLRYWRPWS
jgi:hypothetical protein